MVTFFGFFHPARSLSLADTVLWRSKITITAKGAGKLDARMARMRRRLLF